MAHKNHTVLIIEDNEINRGILGAILEDSYNLYYAENGERGLELMRQHSAEIDVALLDLQMPIMNGYQVLETASNDPELKHVPIIVTTSNDSSDDEELCLKLHASDFVRKPYNPTIVKLRIECFIRLREFASTLNEVEIDNQTGAYTRNAFLHYASQVIKKNPDTDYTLSMIDIRGFKHLHDKYGDEAFNLLRQEIEIMQKVHDSMVTGSYSIDQMVFLHPTLQLNLSEDEKQAWYENKIKNMSLELNVSLKAGVLEHIDTKVDLKEHIDKVHAALSEAKMTYNRYCKFVGKELIEKLQRRSMIEDAMEEALRTGQMKVYYQPKHDAKTEKLIGAEALMRWISPELGFISPGEFIPIFEQNGFVSEADAFVWKETCQNQRKWSDKGLKVVPISVNASRQDFRQADLYERIIAPVVNYQVDDTLMHIEITESLFANLSTQSIEILNHFRKRGIMVELDDFGTGYSSLNSLSELPIDIVKFDMSFVRKLQDPRQQLVMQSCVDLVKRLGLSSVAEGVEDDATRQMLAGFGIDAIQGYYYSKPLPAHEFEAYLTAHQ